MMRLAVVSIAGVMLAGAARAATVINRGAEPVILVVVENGFRMNVALDTGGLEDICGTGCFMTLPDGDRIALTGGETVEIDGSSFVIK